MSRKSRVETAIFKVQADTSELREALDDADFRVAYMAWREPILYATDKILILQHVYRKDVSYKVIFDDIIWPIVRVHFQVRESDYDRFWSVLDRYLGKRMKREGDTWIPVD